jgi:CarD family transcriptional regulator
MDYKIGDKVVYPNHGVGMIEQINYGVLNGKTERYFMIRIVSSDLRVMVPQSNAESVGLRSVMRSNDTAVLFSGAANWCTIGNTASRIQNGCVLGPC